MWPSCFCFTARKSDANCCPRRKVSEEASFTCGPKRSSVPAQEERSTETLLHPGGLEEPSADMVKRMKAPPTSVGVLNVLLRLRPQMFCSSVSSPPELPLPLPLHGRVHVHVRVCVGSVYSEERCVQKSGLHERVCAALLTVRSPTRISCWLLSTCRGGCTSAVVEVSPALPRQAAAGQGGEMRGDWCMCGLVESGGRFREGGLTGCCELLL